MLPLNLDCNEGPWLSAGDELTNCRTSIGHSLSWQLRRSPVPTVPKVSSSNSRLREQRCDEYTVTALFFLQSLPGAPK